MNKFSIIVQAKEVKSLATISLDKIYSAKILTEDKRLMELAQLDADKLIKLTVEVAE